MAYSTKNPTVSNTELRVWQWRSSTGWKLVVNNKTTGRKDIELVYPTGTTIEGDVGGSGGATQVVLPKGSYDVKVKIRGSALAHLVMPVHNP